jgi:hypothetical protein
MYYTSVNVKKSKMERINACGILKAQKFELILRVFIRHARKHKK